MRTSGLLSIILSLGVIGNAVALSGTQGKYYFMFNAAEMSQQINQKYTPTGVGGINLNANKAGLGLYGQAGIGYNIFDDLRFDVMLHYDRGAKIKVNQTINGLKTTLKARESSTGALANLYYDIPLNTKFTPYIMGGVGGMKNSIKISYLNANKNSASGTKSLTKMAYQFGTGFSTHLGVNWDMDLGVRMLNKGQKKKKNNIANSKGVIIPIEDLNTEVAAEPKWARSFLIGLRHSF
jgi:opacity protein-like surface antigen